MIISKQSDIKHKYEIIKLLTAIVDDTYISQYIGFKGGTCAEMSGFLDRFSVDLDFDITKDIDETKFQSSINKIYSGLNLR
ncbi:MAG: nucleotidyl transferase AbiEii/AbiGii toxin family protein, partial [Patescibacteria group bacterium]